MNILHHNTLYFRVAGFLFRLSFPESGKALPEAFTPFLCEPAEDEETISSFRILPGPLPLADEPGHLMEENENDMGKLHLFQTTDGYRVELYGGDEHLHRMYADPAFRSVRLSLAGTDRDGHALSSLLRIACSMAVLPHGAVSLHASTVFDDEGHAFLFMGKSGTGKSTHSALWLTYFAGCGLLNDDNPFVRMDKGIARVYGTPWSGKTPCYKNLSFPIAGIARLKQAKANRFVRQEGIGAFTLLLPGCSVIRQDKRLYDELCNTLVQLAESVPTGVLECLPDREAAFLCRQSFAQTDSKI